MLPENITAIVTRNDTWSGVAASEPFEAGWAREAVFFVRALKQPIGASAKGRVEISPDGIIWIAEGTEFDLPASRDAVAVARVAHFGNWLRVRAEFADGAECTVLVTLHLKA
ncbi:hypothetical protein FPY71_12540 [Aureimonas fodinaquatilis]|uniref:Uncharacterized protein n=1 Tax=Aureimonas fodinaquatilis TaxID=2565783 RepID=A0A5B0DS95_9HYPH|nr:hypothetical protein [Aureimonas fodinaquatilis]KAA0969376.1 hypothetical protein FPY71_12540 [Aureimonas fodinaquatilis]